MKVWGRDVYTPDPLLDMACFARPQPLNVSTLRPLQTYRWTVSLGYAVDSLRPWVIFITYGRMLYAVFWISNADVVTSALIKHAPNKRSFSKRRGSSFQDSIRVTVWVVPDFCICLNGLFHSMDLTSFPVSCHADTGHNVTQQKVIFFILLSCTYWLYSNRNLLSHCHARAALVQ